MAINILPYRSTRRRFSMSDRSFLNSNHRLIQIGDSGFNPMSVSGMAAWWAARKETGFTNNDPVSVATDWSGNGLNLTQTVASKKPLYLTGQKNGQPAFAADGVDDFFTGGNILNIGTGSIHFFFVAKFDSVAALTVLQSKSVAAGVANRYTIYQTTSAGDWEALVTDPSGVNRSTSGGSPDTAWHLFELVVDRPLTRLETFVDGVSVGSDSSVVAGDLTSIFRFLLFAYSNATDTGEQNFMQGKIAEVWCWQRVLTSGERSTLRTELASLYDLNLHPAGISGLKLWLDATEIVGLNDGDPVTTWNDLSGNGNHATQSTASKKPSYTSGQYITFDGIDDWMEIPAIGTIGSNPRSYVFQVKFSVSQLSGLVTMRSSGGAKQFASYVSNASASGNGLRRIGFTTGTIASNRIAAETSDSDSSWHSCALVRTNTSMKLYIDGTLVATESTNVGDVDVNHKTFLGAYADGDTPIGGYFNGDMRKVLIYSSELTAADVLNLYNAGY